MNAEELEKVVASHETQSLETACAFKMPVANVKIVSGGQTGVDRGALEAAMALGLDFGGWSPHGWIAEDGTISWGVTVPHHNRTRVLGGLLCAFYNGRDARCASCAAKMAAFPVNAAFQTVQERFPSQEVIQKAGENIISRQKRC